MKKKKIKWVGNIKWVGKKDLHIEDIVFVFNTVYSFYSILIVLNDRKYFIRYIL